MMTPEQFTEHKAHFEAGFTAGRETIKELLAEIDRLQADNETLRRALRMANQSLARLNSQIAAGNNV